MASPRGLSNNPGSPSSARVPQVYQIDFTAVASGKRIASTKRRVRWYVQYRPRTTITGALLYPMLFPNGIREKRWKRMLRALDHRRNESLEEDLSSTTFLWLVDWPAPIFV
jgi:hypothetical protein